MCCCGVDATLKSFQRMPLMAVQSTHSCGSKAPRFTSYPGACSMAPPAKQPREQERRLCVHSKQELSTSDLPAARAHAQSASGRSQHHSLIRHHSPCGGAREKQRQRPATRKGQGHQLLNSPQLNVCTRCQSLVSPNFLVSSHFILQGLIFILYIYICKLS